MFHLMDQDHLIRRIENEIESTETESDEVATSLVIEKYKKDIQKKYDDASDRPNPTGFMTILNFSKKKK